MRSPLLTCLLAVGLVLPPPPAAAPDCSLLTGAVREYHVASGDSLTSIGARFGVERAVLAGDNGLAANARLRAGQRLSVDARHIAPPAAGSRVVINLPQRMLFVFEAGRPVAAFPAAVGRPDWATPSGTFTVIATEVDPTWDVPVSIQREMAQRGQPVLTKVAPGADNPLGNHWLALSSPGVGIHGTNQPASVHGFTTHGCIRLHPEDIAALFARAGVGTVVEIVYEPVLLTRGDDGTVFLEVHGDPYRRIGTAEARVRTLLEDAGLAHLADTAVVRDAASRRTGRVLVIAPSSPAPAVRR
jgi:L,D-transpeptidase ErfK/SrfK